MHVFTLSFFKTILILFLYLCLYVLSGPFIFFIQICYALVNFMHVACPAHLILFDLIALLLREG
jgi:hypothetical protein